MNSERVSPTSKLSPIRSYIYLVLGQIYAILSPYTHLTDNVLLAADLLPITLIRLVINSPNTWSDCIIKCLKLIGSYIFTQIS